MDRHHDTHANNEHLMLNFYQRFLVMRTLPVPVIGAINGPAIGAGLSLAVGGCDIRVASATATMGFTFTKLGLHPGMGAMHFAPILLGPSAAADLLLTGRVVSAVEALRMGLVNHVCATF
jgi:enoyl-CoA hydratase/carnithine racemase